MNIKELTNDYIEELALSNGITYNITNIYSLNDRLDNPKTAKIAIFSFNFGKSETTGYKNTEFSLQLQYVKATDTFNYILTEVAPQGHTTMTGGTRVKDLNIVKNIISMPRIITALKRMAKKFSVGNKPADIKDFCLRIIEACLTPDDYVNNISVATRIKTSQINIVDMKNVGQLIYRLLKFDPNASVNIQGKCLVVK